MFKNVRPLLFSTLIAALAFGLTACDSDPGAPEPTEPNATGDQQMNSQSAAGSNFEDSNPPANTGNYGDDSSSGSFNEGDPPISSKGYDESSQAGNSGG